MYVEAELLIVPEHPSSPLVFNFNVVCIRSSVFCAMLESRLLGDVLDTALCDNVCQCLAVGR
jgi:hypothetical protein